MSHLPCPLAITLYEFYFLFSLFAFHILPQLPRLIFSNIYRWTVLLPINANLLKSKSPIQLYHQQPEILHCIEAKSRDPATAALVTHITRADPCTSNSHLPAYQHAGSYCLVPQLWPNHAAQQSVHNSSRVGRSAQPMAQCHGDGLHWETGLGKFVTPETGDKLETKSNLNITVVRIS